MVAAPTAVPWFRTALDTKRADFFPPAPDHVELRRLDNKKIFSLVTADCILPEPIDFNQTAPPTEIIKNGVINACPVTNRDIPNMPTMQTGDMEKRRIADNIFLNEGIFCIRIIDFANQSIKQLVSQSWLLALYIRYLMK